MQSKATPRGPIVPGPAARDLHDFLEENQISIRAASESIGVSHPALINWLKGVAKPDHPNRKAIQVWTNGRVHEDSWLTEDERRDLGEVAPYQRPDPEAVPEGDGEPSDSGEHPAAEPPATGTEDE